MSRATLKRNVEIFKDYLEVNDFTKVGEKYGIQKRATTDGFYNVRASMIRWIEREALPLPKSLERTVKSILKEKAYWSEMIPKYLEYLKGKKLIDE